MALRPAGGRKEQCAEPARLGPVRRVLPRAPPAALPRPIANRSPSFVEGWRPSASQRPAIPATRCASRSRPTPGGSTTTAMARRPRSWMAVRRKISSDGHDADSPREGRQAYATTLLRNVKQTFCRRWLDCGRICTPHPTSPQRGEEHDAECPLRRAREGEVVVPQSRSSPFMPAFLRAFLASSVRTLPAW